MTADPLDRGAFREWLAAKEPGEIVGCAGDPCCCPLGRFVRTLMEGAAIGARTVHVDGREVMRLPKWARAFVHAIDDSEDSKPWTASEALAVLDRVSP